MVLHVVVEWRIDYLWCWFSLLDDFCRFRKRIGIWAEIISYSWRGLKRIDGIHFVSSGRIVIVFAIVTCEVITSCKTTAKIIIITTSAWDIIEITIIAVTGGGNNSVRVLAVIGVIIWVIAVRLLLFILGLIYWIRWTQWHRRFLSLAVRRGILKSW